MAVGCDRGARRRLCARQRVVHRMFAFRSTDWFTEQLAECFIGFAGIASAEQHFERAAQLLSVAEANAEARVNPLENIDQIELQRLTAILRKQLGEAEFEALSARGRAMTIEQ